MLMVALCFTEQLPLSSYSMFNIWCGNENEFFPPFDSLLRAAQLPRASCPREVRIHMNQVSVSWRGSSAATDTVELGCKK